MADTTGGKPRTLLVSLLLVVLLAVIGWFGYDVLFQGEAPTADYEIISTEDVGDTAEEHVVFEVRLHTSEPSLRDLRQIGLELRNNADIPWENITVHFYLEGMNPEKATYGVVQLTEAGVTEATLAPE